MDQLGIHDDRHDKVALDFLSLGSHAAGSLSLLASEVFQFSPQRVDC